MAATEKYAGRNPFCIIESVKEILTNKDGSFIDEFIKRTCSNCGYEWWVRTKDDDRE
jgi:hypothetical protein